MYIPNVLKANIKALVLILQCSQIIHSFTQKPLILNKVKKISPSLSQIALTPTSIDPADIDSARKLFYLWFFGGSGGAGIAVSAFPKMYDRFQEMRSLKSSGGEGETIGISPLCGLPEDLKLTDVQQVLNNRMSVNEMVKKGPKDSFWAERGYLRFEAFDAANKKCNPLTVRAVFDAMTTSTSTVEPDVAQELLDSFRDDINAFKKTLLTCKLKGYSAIGLLVFLLGLAAAVSLNALAEGWFPEWPGLDNFPVGLVDPGVWTIPNYWI